MRAESSSRVWNTYVKVMCLCPQDCSYWPLSSRTVKEMKTREYCNSSALNHDHRYHQKKQIKDAQLSKQDESTSSILGSLGKGLRNVDLIDERLAKVDDNSVVYDVRIRHEMQEFKCSAQNVIASRLPMQNSWALNDSVQHALLSEPSERDSITFDSLKVVSEYLRLTVQQRRLVRKAISRQVIQYDNWRKALEELVRQLDTDLKAIDKPSEALQVGKEATARCTQLFSKSLHLSETPSWVKLISDKKVHVPTAKWGDILELFEVISDALRGVETLKFYITKINGMKEGLCHIKDVQLDNNISLQQMHDRQSFVKHKLSQNLGYTSNCLFTLLIFYLFQSIGTIKVDISGGLYGGRDDNLYICMGEIITSADKKMLWRAIKHLDKALSLVKFIYETADMRKSLKLEGHVWTVGTQENMLEYRGNSFFIHGIENPNKSLY